MQGSQRIAVTAVQPDYGNRTSSVSPVGDVSFSHFADAASGKPDYTRGGGALGRMLTRVEPKGTTGMTIAANGDISGTPSEVAARMDLAPEEALHRCCPAGGSLARVAGRGLFLVSASPEPCGSERRLIEAGLHPRVRARPGSVIVPLDAGGEDDRDRDRRA
jgi:hypothetical protein